MGITLILAVFAALLELGLGVAVGWWHGTGIGIVTGIGVLGIAVVGYISVLSLSLSRVGN
jgi:hypothetical protein